MSAPASAVTTQALKLELEDAAARLAGAYAGVADARRELKAALAEWHTLHTVLRKLEAVGTEGKDA